MVAVDLVVSPGDSPPPLLAAAPRSDVFLLLVGFERVGSVARGIAFVFPNCSRLPLFDGHIFSVRLSVSECGIPSSAFLAACSILVVLLYSRGLSPVASRFGGGVSCSVWRLRSSIPPIRISAVTVVFAMPGALNRLLMYWCRLRIQNQNAGQLLLNLLPVPVAFVIFTSLSRMPILLRRIVVWVAGVLPNLRLFAPIARSC